MKPTIQQLEQEIGVLWPMYRSLEEDIHIKAGQRITHWNEKMTDWHYSIVGWNVEGIEP